MKKTVSDVIENIERQLAAAEKAVARANGGHYYDARAEEFKQGEPGEHPQRSRDMAVYQQLGWYAAMLLSTLDQLREIEAQDGLVTRHELTRDVALGTEERLRAAGFPVRAFKRIGEDSWSVRATAPASAVENAIEFVTERSR